MHTSSEQTWNEGTFPSFDGIELFYRYALPRQPTQKTLVFLHRGHEHSGRVIPFANELSNGQYQCFAYDIRGHGQSGGETAWAESFDTWVKDLNSFIGMLRQQHNVNPNNIVIIANSVGSAVATNWIINYGVAIRGIVLGAPAFDIRLYVPFAYTFLNFARRFSNKLFVTSYVKSKLLTNNREEAQSYDNDPMITKKIGVNVLVSLLSSMKTLFTRLEDFETPVLVVTAGQDYIVKNGLHGEFIEKISSSIKKHITIDNYKHAVFHENDRHTIRKHCENFIQPLFEQRSQLPAIIEPRPHTVAEYQNLQGEGSTPQRLYYWAFRGIFSTLGKQSNGIATGLDYGFDSGVSLDYIYHNTPSGKSLFGKAIDYIYLNSVGWRNIRKRKRHLLESLGILTDKLISDKREPVILDIASGAGRYLFDLQESFHNKLTLHLNDVDEHSLSLAKKHAQQREIKQVTFSSHDIFDNQLTDNLSTPPNIVVISGVFELYNNNELVINALKRIYDNMAENSYLVYSGQPWHPQLQLIARLLNNRLGQRWIMRRRVQRELDDMITVAGFEKLHTLADDMGIFTISCAAKNYK